MSKPMRWMLRLVSLAFLAGVWWVVPVLMPGPSRLLSLFHLCCLVVVIDFSVLALLATFVPSRTQRPSIPAPLHRNPDAEALRQAALRDLAKQGERHER